MKTYINILLLFITALLLHGCDSTEPDKDAHPNITWKIYTLGNNDSNIRDLFVIDENNIWVVGEIQDEFTDTYDSFGNWIDPYNVGIWDGKKWELKTVYFEGSFGQYQTIWAFNKNDIWFGATGAYVHWNGAFYTYYRISETQAQGPESRVWGSSNGTLFLADNIGTILFFDGASWNTKLKIEAKNIRDLYGVNGSNILFASYADYFSPNNRLYKIVDNKGYDLKWDATRTVYNIWTDNPDILWAAADDVCKWEKGSWKTLAFTNSSNAINVRGTSQENIYVVGSEKLVAHYNGKSWQTYDIGLNEYATFNTLSVKDNIIALAGHSERGFIVVVGRIN